MTEMVVLQSDCASEPFGGFATHNWPSHDLSTQTESRLRFFRTFQVNRSIYESDFRWDSTRVGRFESLAKTLPPVLTRGSIVVERGKPHFKAAPLVECPRCQSKLSRGTVTLTFRQAPAATQAQQVQGWVCPCGEFYVPGETARDAYLRAFQPSPGD
jgi:hypothetical protein